MPSITESLFALGLGPRLVGITDWCVHPAEEVARVRKVGGTKDPDLDAIAALRPDLVIANREENTRRAVRKLEAAGLDVWVTYPRTLREAAELLAALAGLGATDAARARVLGPVERAIDEAERAPSARVRVFCPIWRDPWMGIGEDTYAHDLLTLSGGENPFARAGDRRYPRLELADVVRAAPEVILLPDEPYAFSSRDAAELAELDVPAARSGRIHLIDGTFVSWYGPRIVPALREIRALLSPPRLQGEGSPSGSSVPTSP